MRLPVTLSLALKGHGTPEEVEAAVSGLGPAAESPDRATRPAARRDDEHSAA